MGLTGGELNRLNGKYGISAPDKSVPVMKLIKVHKPKSNEMLVSLIKEHSEKKCECGIRSQGTIEDFGNNLYNVQMQEWGRYKYTLQECINWEYNLFVIQSLKGNLIEEKAKNILSAKFNDLDICYANDFYDEEFRIDLEIKHSGKTVAGIQVKPSSYKMVRQNVKSMNKYKNSLVDFPVFYLYYDYDSEDFLNLSDIFKKLN